MPRKCHIEVMKKLCRFRISTVGKTATFFADWALWLVKPSHVSSVALTLQLASRKLRREPSVGSGTRF